MALCGRSDGGRAIAGGPQHDSGPNHDARMMASHHGSHEMQPGDPNARPQLSTGPGPRVCFSGSKNEKCEEPPSISKTNFTNGSTPRLSREIIPQHSGPPDDRTRRHRTPALRLRIPYCLPPTAFAFSADASVVKEPGRLPALRTITVRAPADRNKIDASGLRAQRSKM